MVGYVGPHTSGLVSTLNMTFSVTYYLELHNTIIVYCTSHFLPAKVQLVVWTLQNIKPLLGIKIN